MDQTAQALERSPRDLENYSTFHKTFPPLRNQFVLFSSIPPFFLSLAVFTAAVFVLAGTYFSVGGNKIKGHDPVQAISVMRIPF